MQQSLMLCSRQWLTRLCRFPFQEPLTLQSGETVSSAQVIEAMSQFVEPARLARIDQVGILPLCMPDARSGTARCLFRCSMLQEQGAQVAIDLTH